MDLKRMCELGSVQSGPDGGVEIGAAMSATRVARHDTIAGAYPAIATSARLIGAVQVQNRASLGGNVCNAAPSADAVPGSMCYEAWAHITGPKGRTQLTHDAFVLGPGKTVLEPDELLVSLVLPPVLQRSATIYLRFTPRREMDIAVAGVAVRLDLAEDRSLALARVALASVGPTPLRAVAAEQILQGNRLNRDLAAAAEIGRASCREAE